MEKAMLAEACGIKPFKNIDDILGDFLFLDPYKSTQEFIESSSHAFDSLESLQEFLRLRRVRENRGKFCSVALRELNIEDSKKTEALVVLDQLIQRQGSVDFNAQEFISFFHRKSPEKNYVPILEAVYYELIQALLLLMIPSVEDIYNIVKECCDRDGFIGDFRPGSLRALDSYKSLVADMEEKGCEYLFLIEGIDKMYSKMIKWNDLNEKYFSGKRGKALQGTWNWDMFFLAYFQGKEWQKIIGDDVSYFFGRVRREIKGAYEVIGTNALIALEGEEDVSHVDKDIEIGKKLSDMRKSLSENLSSVEEELEDKDEVFLVNQKTLGYRSTLRLLLSDFAANIDLKI